MQYISHFPKQRPIHNFNSLDNVSKLCAIICPLDVILIESEVKGDTGWGEGDYHKYLQFVYDSSKPENISEVWVLKA